MFSHQYIKMCIEGREEIEFVRVSNTTEGGWLGKFALKKGDYSHHSKMGEYEVRGVVHVEKSNIRAVDDPKPYKLEECVWIPPADQLAEEVQQIPWALHKDTAKDYYKLQNHILSTLSDEE